MRTRDTVYGPCFLTFSNFAFHIHEGDTTAATNSMYADTNEPLLPVTPMSQDEPLLNLPEPLTPIQQQRSIMRSVIAGDDEDSSYEAEQVENYALVFLRLWGRPYAARRKFWTKSWPLSLLLGGLLGLATVGFLGLVHFLLGLWFSNEGGPTKEPAVWLWVTVGGGFLSSLFLALPPAPKLIRTIFHDVHDLKGNVVETLFLVVSSLIALATGAPLGPETAIGALGSGLATFVSKQLKLDRRTEAGLVHSGLVGSLGGLFLSPILGASLVHELSVTGRAPSSLFLDGLIATEIGVPREALPSHMDHDVMELVTLGGTAATSAYVVFQVLAPLVTSVQGEWYNQVIDLGQEGDFHLWHLPAAIIIGSFCGKAGMLAMGLIGMFQWIRSSISNFLQRRLKVPQWVSQVLFCTIAGALHGLLSLWNPLLGGSGMSLMQHVLQQQVTFHDVPWFMATAACKIVSMSLCLGFGMVGGPIFPMLFVGLCLGMTMTPLLPISFAVPCCMCATVGSFLPIPFTLVIYTAFTMSLTVHQVGPVFVATFVAYGVVGGLGTMKNLGEKRMGVTAEPPTSYPSHWQPTAAADDDDDEVFQYEAMEGGGDDDEDDEQMREVRNAVFGGGNTTF